MQVTAYSSYSLFYKALATGIILLMVMVENSFGQTLSSSAYSFYGIGSLYRQGSAYNHTLGGTGIGLRDGYSINTLNPASYTGIAQPFSQLTEAGIMVTSGSQIDGSRSENEIDLDFTGLNLWFRFNQSWSGVVGLKPYSTVDYHISDEASFIGIGSQYNTEYVGTGGLSRAYFGVARSIKNLSLGANISYIFGPLMSEQYITSSSTADWEVQQNTYLSTLNMQLGAQYTLKWERSDLTLGATYQLKSSLDGTYTYQVLQAGTIVETDDDNVDNYILPQSAGVGISYSRNNRWRISADVYQENWSDARFESGYQLRDARRYSMGLEALSDPRNLSYLRRMGFSAGVFYEENYLDISSNAITTQGVTAGVKFPTSGTSLIQLGIEHYLNGNENLILQNYTQVSLSISFFDFWFVKRKME